MLNPFTLDSLATRDVLGPTSSLTQQPVIPAPAPRPAALAAGDPDRARLRMANHLLEVEGFARTAATP